MIHENNRYIIVKHNGYIRHHFNFFILIVHHFKYALLTFNNTWFEQEKKRVERGKMRLWVLLKSVLEKLNKTKVSLWCWQQSRVCLVLFRRWPIEDIYYYSSTFQISKNIMYKWQLSVSTIYFENSLDHLYYISFILFSKHFQYL